MRKSVEIKDRLAVSKVESPTVERKLAIHPEELANSKHDPQDMWVLVFNCHRKVISGVRAQMLFKQEVLRTHDSVVTHSLRFVALAKIDASEDIIRVVM